MIGLGQEWRWDPPREEEMWPAGGVLVGIERMEIGAKFGW